MFLLLIEDLEFSDVDLFIEGDKFFWFCIESIVMLKGDWFELFFIDEELENGDILELVLDKLFGIFLLLVDKFVGNIDVDSLLLVKGLEVMDDILLFLVKLFLGVLLEVISLGLYIIDLLDKVLNVKKVWKKKNINEGIYIFNRFFFKIIFLNSCY